jgi:early secretory antigenic target protein ESAT-6
MGDYTKAVFGQLEQSRADFAGSYSALQDTISTLDGQLRASLAEWDGSAQQAYYAAKAVWDSAMADMANVLNQLGVVIGVADANYTAAESANTALWG